jgi:hypothetical protein
MQVTVRVCVLQLTYRQRVHHHDKQGTQFHILHTRLHTTDVDI